MKTILHAEKVKKFFPNVSLLLALSITFTAYLFYHSPDFPFTPDSASYIDQSRSLVNNGSALITPWGLTPSNQYQIKDPLFPIGFPIVIASLSLLFNFDAKDVTIGLAYLSSVVLPWLIFFSFRKILGNKNSIIIAALSIFSPSLLKFSPLGIPDTFSLAIVISSIGIILNSKSVKGFFIGGLLSGMAYAVRNAHLALILTYFFYFIFLWSFSNQKDRHLIYKQAAGCFIGVSLIVIPLLTRNLILFGTLNPYKMPPSTIGFIENTRTYIQALLFDLTSCKFCAHQIAWSIPGLLLLALVMISLLFLNRLNTWNKLSIAEKNTFIILCIYTFIGSMIVIAARTTYQWGEIIGLRHTLQYIPFVIAIFLISISEKSQLTRKVKWTLIFTLTFLDINHVYSIELKYKTKQSDSLNAFNAGKSHLCIDDKNTLLASNFAFVFRIQCNAKTRHVENINNNQSLQETSNYTIIDIADDIKDKAIGKPIHAGFFPGIYGFYNDQFPISDLEIQTLHDNDWIIIKNDKQGLLIRHLNTRDS